MTLLVPFALAVVPEPDAPAEPADSTPEPTDAAAELPPAETPAETPAEPEDDKEPAEAPDAGEGDQRISKFITALEEKPNLVQRVKVIMQVINKITADDDKKRKIGKLSLLKRAIDRKVSKIN